MLLYATPIRELLADVSVLPDLLTVPGGALDAALDRIYFTTVAASSLDGGYGISIQLVLAEEIRIGLAGLDSFSLVIGGGDGGDGTSALDVAVAIGPRGVSARVENARVALRFPTDVLRPMPELPGATAPPYVEIAVRASLELDDQGDVHLDTLDGMSLGPAMIGESGVVISAENVKLDLSRTSTLPEVLAAGFDDSFIGAYIGRARVRMPEGLSSLLPEELLLENVAIGSGGVSGHLQLQFTPVFDEAARVFTGPGGGTLFGLTFGLEDVELTIRQNAFERFRLLGQILLPFFDKRLAAEISLGLDGSCSARLAGVVEPGDGEAAGVLRLSKRGLFDLVIDTLGFELDGGVFTAVVSGELTPRIGGLDWPTFQVRELAIDSEGNVRLDGGWLDLSEQYSLDFHGFRIEVTRLGFGKTEDGGRWIGLSGALNLVDGLAAGASVEGLRLIWYDDGRTRVTLNGVGVELEVPDVLRLNGAVSYQELPGNVHRFDGDVRLQLVALDLEIDAKLVIGRDEDRDFNFFAIYVGVELPAGIPLWATGLGLYGMAGLFALEMATNKGASPNALHPTSRADEEWYENRDGSPGWYLRAPAGVTELRSKWDPEPEALALGAGITLGTVFDNGFTVSGRLLLVIVFPGPILLLEGKASLLRERASLADNPMFRALAVLDGRSGTFLMGLDARYSIGAVGELIDIRASAEAFFSLSDPDAWHLYLGMKEPRERRIRAAIVFHIFEANAYFMLDMRQLALGAWVGYEARWEFGPARAILEAWIEGNVLVSWKPVHLHGDYWLHGKVELTLFGVGFGLGVDVKLAADVFEPFHLLGELHIEVVTPWPLPNISVTVTLEWGPEPVPPPLPATLKEIAVEHLKVTTSWPLSPAIGLLQPSLDRGDGFLLDRPLPLPGAQPTDEPVVPLDCRPRLTFGRAVHDAAGVGMNGQPPVPPTERIGDPGKNEGPVAATYRLDEIALSRLDGSTWTPVAWAPNTSADPLDATRLYGSWAPVPGVGEDSFSQVKLWLWSKTPFDFTRHGGRAWDEWFTARAPRYPCVPPIAEREICCDFGWLDPADRVRSPWECPLHQGFVLSWRAPERVAVRIFNPAIDGFAQALCFPSLGGYNDLGVAQPNAITVELPEPAAVVRFVLVDSEGVEGTGFDAQGNPYGPFSGGRRADPHLEVRGSGLVRVVLRGYSQTCLFSVCAIVPPEPGEVERREAIAQHLRDEMLRWSHPDNVLEPYTRYQLRVVTSVTATGEGEMDWYSESVSQVQYAYFRTEGPPGLTRLSVPAGASSLEEIVRRDETGRVLVAAPDGTVTALPPGTSLTAVPAGSRLVLRSELDGLVPYVRQTVPATVPGPGEPPPLPRPVYRAYDVGVEFDENYVELMYRLAHRDLALHLYDANDRPVRDPEGRLVSPLNRWGRTEQLTLTDSERQLVTVVNGGDCAEIVVRDIRRDTTLETSPVGQVLDADTLYEARLIPLLHHDDFRAVSIGAVAAGPAGTLARWHVQDEGSNGIPSRWEAGATGVPPARHVAQTRDVWGGSLDGADPVKPGTLLVLGDDPRVAADHPDQPLTWTDYRFSVTVRSTSPAAVGVAFRYQDSAHQYRFSMDRERRYRRLVRIAGGAHTVLAEDDQPYPLDQDFRVTVEAIGSSLRVYLDDEPVFTATDEALPFGSVALYCWRNDGVRFGDVRIEDFRPQAPLIHRFRFTTSNFSSFFHHLHSYQDETWELPFPELSGDAIAALAAQASPLDGLAVDDPARSDETRGFDALAAQVLGPAAHQNPPDVQVTRLTRDGHTRALLVRSPEPIDWRRTDLEVDRTDAALPPADIPGHVKLTDVTVGAREPNDESASVLLRERVDLTGQRIEIRQFPGALLETADPVLLVEEFDGSGGLLYREDFSSTALGRYTIVDEGTQLAPSAWAISGGHLGQSSPIFDGSTWSGVPAKPGTLAVTGSGDWTGVRVHATLRSEAVGSIGLVFRYADGDHYYRFSMHRPRRGSGPLRIAQRAYRRLVRRAGARTTVLWEDGVEYDLGRSYRLRIEAFADQIVGYLDDTLLFSVREAEVRAGRVGFYCWNNPAAHFEALEVESLEHAPVLWQPALPDLGELEVVDAPGAIFGPSTWAAAGGVLTQSSNVHVLDNSPAKPGTLALGGAADWEDIELSVRLGSDDGDAIGAVFRYQDADNYYRFSMDRQRSYRRLIRKTGAVVSVLWQDAVRYEIGRVYDLTLRAVGSVLEGFLDGRRLFRCIDPVIQRGRVGLYCWADFGARFARIVVTDRTRRVGRWTIHDDPGTNGGPSVWALAGGALRQRSPINGFVPAPGGLGDFLGTCAVAGDSTWTDYRITVEMRGDGDYAQGIVFRYVDQDNHYRFSLDTNAPWRRLVRKQGGVLSELALKLGVGYTVGEPFTLTVDAVGSRLVGFVDGVRVFDVRDPAPLPAGKIGLYSYANDGARFERVEVRGVPLEGLALLRDRFAELDTSAWAFVDEGMAGGPSHWMAEGSALLQTGLIHTQPIDRDTLDKRGTHALAGDLAWSDIAVTARLTSSGAGAVGLLLRCADANHYYRFSMDRTAGYRRLVKNVGGRFNLLWEDDFRHEPDRAYEVAICAEGATLRGYFDGVPMFVVQDGELPTGRVGLYCWREGTARFSDVGVYPPTAIFRDWLLDESFNSLSASRWTTVDEGDQDVPSRWASQGGALRQTSWIHGGLTDPAVLDKPGSYVIAGVDGWDDYRVSVQLRTEEVPAIGIRRFLRETLDWVLGAESGRRPVRFLEPILRPAPSGAIGVLFRYRDPQNYYRFSMDSTSGYRRLVRVLAGVVSVLREDHVAHALGLDYVVTIDCAGDRLRVLLDGVSIFDVTDGTVSSGRVGLYCWRNSGAVFKDVRVAAAGWSPYHVFGPDRALPAGARLRVRAGPRTAAPVADPGVLDRFAAPIGGNGRLRFSARGVTLRIVDARGVPGHRRHFLPTGGYRLSEFRVLRNADGTAFFLLRPDGTALAPGSYRLRWRYRRDNRAVEPDSQILRESGRTEPEDVTIDVP